MIVTLHIAVDVLIYLLVFVLVPDHLFATDNALVEEFAQEEDDLDAADDGEPRKESHRASDETQLGFGLDLLVSLDVVEGRRVEVDPDESEVCFNGHLNSWKRSLIDANCKMN